MDIVISSGHSKYCRGASGYIDEVDEARRVVDRVFEYLNSAGVGVTKFHDNISHTQSENLNRIVDFHNNHIRDLDVSVHFNAYETTNTPMGTECLYVTQGVLAQGVATAISTVSDLKNRGPKKHTDLFFLNNTEEPAILIEVCFVDSKTDAELYENNFDKICVAIAETVSDVIINGGNGAVGPLFRVVGKASSFGGPDDTGVSPSESLAFITDINQAPQLFLPTQPTGTTGLARRLNPYVHYVACRWNYNKTPRDMLRERVALVTANGISLKAFPADWGPNESTGRVADLSPCLMDDLSIETDDEVEVNFPI